MIVPNSHLSEITQRKSQIAASFLTNQEPRPHRYWLDDRRLLFVLEVGLVERSLGWYRCLSEALMSYIWSLVSSLRHGELSVSTQSFVVIHHKYERKEKGGCKGPHVGIDEIILWYGRRHRQTVRLKLPLLWSYLRRTFQYKGGSLS